MSAPTLWPQRGDTGLTAARKVAVVYRTHLHTANPTGCDRIDDAMRRLGHLWIVPQLVTYDMETLVEFPEAAIVAGRGEDAIRKWHTRGYADRAGERRYLTVRGLSETGAKMFQVGEILEIVATLRARKPLA